MPNGHQKCQVAQNITFNGGVGHVALESPGTVVTTVTMPHSTYLMTLLAVSLQFLPTAAAAAAAAVTEQVWGLRPLSLAMRVGAQGRLHHLTVATATAGEGVIRSKAVGKYCLSPRCGN